MIDKVHYQDRITAAKEQYKNEDNLLLSTLIQITNELRADLKKEFEQIRNSLPCTCTWVDLTNTKFPNIIKPKQYSLNILLAIIIDGLKE